MRRAWNGHALRGQPQSDRRPCCRLLWTCTQQSRPASSIVVQALSPPHVGAAVASLVVVSFHCICVLKAGRVSGPAGQVERHKTSSSAHLQRSRKRSLFTLPRAEIGHGPTGPVPAVQKLTPLSPCLPTDGRLQLPVTQFLKDVELPRPLTPKCEKGRGFA